MIILLPIITIMMFLLKQTRKIHQLVMVNQLTTTSLQLTIRWERMCLLLPKTLYCFLQLKPLQ